MAGGWSGPAGLLGVVLCLMFLNGLKIAAACASAGDVARGAAYLLACAPVRIALAAFLPRYPPEVLFLVGAAFAAQHLSGSAEAGFFGGKVWWRRLRPVHAAAFVMAGGLACDERPRAAQAVLLLDLAVGLAARLAV